MLSIKLYKLFTFNHIKVLSISNHDVLNVINFETQKFISDKKMSDIKANAQTYGLQEKKIPCTQIIPTFGQILTSSSETKGAIQSIDEFKGRRIIGISGGIKKAFMFEEVDESQNVVTAMHPESEDYLEHNGQEVAPIDEIVTAVDGLRIIQILSGKTHNIIRTEEGKIYSYGKGEFGSLGLGGCMFSPVPRLISKLDNKKIIAVACGAHHSMALSEIGDLFSWGRGFEGQLGLLETTESTSTPQFIPHFFKYDHSKDVKMLRKKPIHKIACGSYHSLAIDEDGALYAWGEARCGQTGTGRKIKEWKPVKLDIQIEGEKRKIQKVSGGYSHSICLTTEGQLFGWGLNVKGQVGVNDLKEGMKSIQGKIDYQKSVLHPAHISKTRDDEPLPKFTDVTCGLSRSFAIDENGAVWGWGGGTLGFKDKFSERGPVKLTEGTDNKRFTKIFANQDLLVIFAPFSPSYFKPALVPSKGGTQMTFFGTGFTDTGYQSIVFTFGKVTQEIPLQYDSKTSTFYCQVPNFDAQKKDIPYPVECEVLISLDGKKYTPYEKKLLVYSQKLSMQSIEPKSCSALGGTQAKIYMPLHPLIQQYGESITVGFKSNTTVDAETKLQDWICVQGTYEQQKIVCKFPNVPNFDNQDPFYVVDVSLNGQQFTNHPQTIRFYLITDTVITPNQGNQQQQPEITITGKGLFDTPFKTLTLELCFSYEGNEYNCHKSIQSTWNKTQKKFTFKMPTLNWILGDINITQQLLSEARKWPLSIKLNLSQKDPIEVGKYKFVIPPPPEEPEQQTDKKGGKKDGKKAGKK